MWNAETDEDADLSEVSDVSSVYYGESDWMVAENSPSKSPGNTVSTDKEDGLRLFYPESSPQCVILILKHPQCLAFSGKLALKVLWGAVDVYGYIIKPCVEELLNLFSPISSSLLKLKTFEGEPISTLNLIRDRERVCNYLVQRHKWTCKDAIAVLKTIQPNSVGVLIQDVASHIKIHVEKFYSTLFSPSCRARGVTSSILPTTYKCELFDPTTVPSMYCEDWYNTADMVKNHILQNISPPRVIVCGGKNVGKSTMLRFLINSILNDCNTVCCIDGDPGQSEFTPPGLLSLHVISEPCLGPGFTQSRTSAKTIFVGDCTPADHPLHYISSFRDLLILYEKDYSKLPLLVNTMGWNRGIGLALLSDIIQLIQPSHVIQIDSKDFPSRNFSDLSFTNIEKLPGWSLGLPTASKFKPYVHIVKHSAVKFESAQNESARFRDISLISYLCNFQSGQLPWQGLSRLPYRRISWSSVALHVYGGILDNRDILYAFNGSLIAICQCDPAEMTSASDERLPKFLSRMPVCVCYGYGVVRGISMEDQCFFVLSSLDSNTWVKVNAFIKGGISIPLKLLVEQNIRVGKSEEDKIQIHVPYVVKRKTTIVSSMIGQKVVPARSFRMKRSSF